MLARWTAALLVGFGLFSSGCDAGESTLTPPRGDATDMGSDEDLGSADGLAPTAVATHGHLKVVNAHIQDESGQPVQLKGVSSMWLNWEDDGYAENLTALRWMRNNWNLTVIRAAMGVEPSGAYLSDPAKAKEQLYAVVDNAITAGVYVLVDFHDHHANTHQDKAVEFFTEVAKKYAGVPNVIYETFNEPVDVTWPDLKIYHQAVVNAIREQDPEALIVLGTPNYSQGVDEASADPVNGTNLLYTLHFYSCTHKGGYRQKGDVAMANGQAVFVTEWGATNADGGLDGLLCLDEAQLWIDWMKNNGVSWTAWKLDGCEPDSSCLLMPGAPVGGGWTDAYLHGHGQFVRGRIQK